MPPLYSGGIYRVWVGVPSNPPHKKDPWDTPGVFSYAVSSASSISMYPTNFSGGSGIPMTSLSTSGISPPAIRLNPSSVKNTDISTNLLEFFGVEPLEIILSWDNPENQLGVLLMDKNVKIGNVLLGTPPTDSLGVPPHPRLPHERYLTSRAVHDILKMSAGAPLQNTRVYRRR